MASSSMSCIDAIELSATFASCSTWFISVVTFSVMFMILAAKSVSVESIFSTASWDCIASFPISWATTAKPLPDSPALAASIEAFSESRFVLFAILWTSSMILLIFFISPASEVMFPAKSSPVFFVVFRSFTTFRKSSFPCMIASCIWLKASVTSLAPVSDSFELSTNSSKDSLSSDILSLLWFICSAKSSTLLSTIAKVSLASSRLLESTSDSSDIFCESA